MSRVRQRARARKPVPAPSRAARARVDGVDGLRGAAIILMFIYHFAFDLRFYGVTASDFEHDPFWLGFRAVIVSLFMGLVGISLVLADRAGDPPPHLWKRIGVIAGCALAASLGSWLLFPRSFIYFGILHAIAVASVLASPAVRHPRIALAIGVAMIGAAFLVSHPVFDLRALSWIGFTTKKPITEDYVPLIPWAGVVFVGVALGHALARRGFRDVRLFGALPGLAWLGRHSLVIYMVHQPILLGILWAAVGR